MIKLMILHFIADFLLQPREMGKNKSSNYYYLFGHLLIQFLVFLPFVGWQFSLLNALIHGLIDKNIWNLYKIIAGLRLKKIVARNPKTTMQEEIANFKFWEDHWFYATIGFDQMLHMITLIYLYNAKI